MVATTKLRLLEQNRSLLVRINRKKATAVYEDKSSGGGEITPPAKKDGLSGGQIAGIVIGTLLFAGIGGFAIFWFAVKKKNFKDLGEAFKRMGEAFKRMGEALKSKCEELKNKSKKNKD